MSVTENVFSVQNQIHQWHRYLSKNEHETYRKINKGAKRNNYKGSVVLCGYGEPMLHKNVHFKIIEAAFVEIVTNGDPLTKNKIKNFIIQMNKILISLYDGQNK